MSYNMDAPMGMTSVCVFVYTYIQYYNYVSTVTVNTKFIAFMKRSIIRDPVDERYQHATCLHQLPRCNWETQTGNLLNPTSLFLLKSTLTDNLDIDSNWNYFHQNYTKPIEQSIPSRMTKSKPHLPWITKNIIRMQRKRDKTHAKAKKTKKNKHWEHLKNPREVVKKEITKSYHNYINNIIGESLSTNPKCFWSFIKQTKTENLGIPTLHSNDKMQTTDHDKANTLNNHFKSVFTNEQLPIPSKGPSQFPSLQTLDIGVNGVRKQLEALKPHKASGPDEIPARVLKETASEISTIVQHIFQQSYTTGKLPQAWTTGHVTPIYKKGNKSNPVNYRPISLTCILCKVMEHLVLSHMWKQC